MKDIYKTILILITCFFFNYAKSQSPERLPMRKALLNTSRFEFNHKLFVLDYTYIFFHKLEKKQPTRADTLLQVDSLKEVCIDLIKKKKYKNAESIYSSILNIQKHEKFRNALKYDLIKSFAETVHKNHLGKIPERDSLILNFERDMKIAWCGVTHDQLESALDYSMKNILFENDCLIICGDLFKVSSTNIFNEIYRNQFIRYLKKRYKKGQLRKALEASYKDIKLGYSFTGNSDFLGYKIEWKLPKEFRKRNVDKSKALISARNEFLNSKFYREMIK